MRLGRSVLALSICAMLPDSMAKSSDAAPEPEEIVREFYTFLLSDDPPEKGPPLFHDPSLFLTGRIGGSDDSAATAELWSWFRSRKEVLGFHGLTSGTEFRKVALRRIFGIDCRDQKARFIGVTVLATLFPKGKDGIWKEVFFPVETRSGRTRIGPVGITVNGIMLDPQKEWPRRDSLYESLGFR